ncbi:MAG TPA: tetratricopeptide repeat protein [Acidobacteriota bacterium]|nr:tetratricopeptide repeat protein [Acidobacteriota bacterium]
MKFVSKCAAPAAILLLAFGWTFAGGKALEFSSDSEKAVELVDEITHGIESFQAGPALAAKAQELIDADPEWAFGYMVASQFQPNPQAQEMLAKADELAANLNEGEKLYLEGVKHIRAGTLPEALEVFQKMARGWPEERRAHMLVGQLSMGSDAESACRSFDRAFKLDNSTPRIYFFRGNCQLLDSKYGKARKTYRKGLAKADNFPFGLHFGTILTHVHEGHVDKALSAVDQALAGYIEAGNAQAFPTVFIHNLRARINLENGRLEEAMTDYEKGLKSLEGSGLPEQQIQIWTGRYHHGKGRTLAKMGKDDAAWAEVEWMRKALDEGGSQAVNFEAAYHYLAGYVKLEAGEIDAAIEHLEQASPTDAFHQLLLARAYHKDGQEEKARETYEKVAAMTTVNLERALSYEEAVRMANNLETVD